MKNDIIIKSTIDSTQIAFLEDQRLVEYMEEENEVSFSIGNIYVARVKRVVSGLNAAFVNIGHERDGFLHYLDLGPQFFTLQNFLKKMLAASTIPKLFNSKKYHIPKILDKNGKIEDVVKVGDKLIVQIVKEPISTKGPRLTSELSLAGRNIILIPFSNKVFISQKIRDLEERNRLLRLMKSIKSPHFGIILRTLAEGTKAAMLHRELTTLMEKWDQVMAAFNQSSIPALLLNEIDRTRAYLRDILNPSFDNIYVNDENTFYQVKDYLTTIAPEKESIVKLVNGRGDIFKKFKIHSQIKKKFGKTVRLKDSGYIVIEHPEAFHVIDVNSGQNKKAESQEENAMMINLSACEEIAIQIRLRDMGGIIIIDFIDMKETKNKKQLLQKMKELLRQDRAKHRVYALTKLGLMQITRQRLRSETKIEVQENCPSCNGTGKISATILLEDEIEQKIGQIVETAGIKKLTLKAHPYLAGFLTKGIMNIRRSWQKKYKIKLKIEEDAALALVNYEIYDVNEMLVDV